MSTSQGPPQTQKALVQDAPSSPLILKEVPVPTTTPGSITIRILCVNVLSYAGAVYHGSLGYTYPTPCIPGGSCIARIVAVGADATCLAPGDLIYVDTLIRARDDPKTRILAGLFDGMSERGRKLMGEGWRDWTYAEYARVPMEVVFRLNEDVLLGTGEGKLGLKVEDLMYMQQLLIPFGGMRAVGLQAGEKVIVAPGSGTFGGAGVKVASAMGAHVVAVGRNAKALEEVKALSSVGKIDVVALNGDVEKDVGALRADGPADVFFDISPPQAAKSTHYKAAILSLAQGGRVAFMGGVREDLPLPVAAMMTGSITFKGNFMYQREDVVFLIRMVEQGMVKLGEKGGIGVLGKFKLEEWEEAFEVAAKESSSRKIVLLTP